MDENGYISMVVVLILIITSIFSSNIVNNIDNEIRVVNLELEKHKVKSNRYNSYLEMISERGFIEKQILEHFRDEGPFSRSINFTKGDRTYFLKFYKDEEGIIKIKVKEKDERNSELIHNYGEIIKDLFKDDIIRCEQLNDVDKKYIDEFMLNLSSCDSQYIGHYESIEDIRNLKDNMRIKYIDGDLYIDENLEIQGIIIVKGEVYLEEDINLKINGKLICKDMSETGVVEIDNQRYDILLSYSKYIPGFLEYRPEVIKLY